MPAVYLPIALAEFLCLSILGFLALRWRLRSQLSEERERAMRGVLEVQRAKTAAVEEALHSSEGERHRLERDFAEFRARGEERRRATEEKLGLLGRAEEEMGKNLRLAAVEAAEGALKQLEERQRSLSEAERRKIGDMLEPMRETMRSLDERVQRAEGQRREFQGRFEENLRQLFSLQQALDGETRGLRAALSQSHFRGRWGEVQLRRLVELAGMQAHVDFEEQVAVSAEGATLRADMLIHLPGGRKIVVDAKAVMEAHVEAVGNAEERNGLLRRHGQYVFERVQELGRKNYWKFFDPTFDYVVLFLPGENLYADALGARPELFEEALSRHVLLASPMTLLALLKTIAHGWAQAAVEREAQQIVELGKELQERLRVVFEKIADIGRHLGRTLDAYNGTVASLERRLRPTLGKFEQLHSLRSPPLPPCEGLEGAVSALSCGPAASGTAGEKPAPVDSA
jgi:DNA recombination protein RmuC